MQPGSSFDDSHFERASLTKLVSWSKQGPYIQGWSQTHSVLNIILYLGHLLLLECQNGRCTGPYPAYVMLWCWEWAPELHACYASTTDEAASPAHRQNLGYCFCFVLLFTGAVCNWTSQATHKWLLVPQHVKPVPSLLHHEVSYLLVSLGQHATLSYRRHG